MLRKTPTNFDPTSRLRSVEAWLEENLAKPLWATMAPSGDEVRAYIVRGRLVLVLVWAHDKGFELCVAPTDNGTIAATFEAADALLGYPRGAAAGAANENQPRQSDEHDVSNSDSGDVETDAEQPMSGSALDPRPLQQMLATGSLDGYCQVIDHEIQAVLTGSLNRLDVSEGLKARLLAPRTTKRRRQK